MQSGRSTKREPISRIHCSADACANARSSCWTTGKSARQILGNPDDLKFLSSMTLFARAAPIEPLFRDALAKYFNGEEDTMTVTLLG
jgi:uncharacterized protein (DUF1810 family)